MKINRYVTVILLFVVLAEGSNATYSVWGLRRLITEAPTDNSPPENIPPVPSPISNAKEPKANPIDGDKSAKGKPIPNAKEQKASPAGGDKSTNDKPKDDLHVSDEPTNDKPKEDPQVSNDPGKTNPKSPNENDNKTSTADPRSESPAGSGKKDVKKEINDGNADSKSGGNGSCEGSIEPCRLLKNLTACVQILESGSKELALLIQNEGESTLKVNITMPASLTNVVVEHVIPVKQTQKVLANGGSIAILEDPDVI